MQANFKFGKPHRIAARKHKKSLRIYVVGLQRFGCNLMEKFVAVSSSKAIQKAAVKWQVRAFQKYITWKSGKRLKITGRRSSKKYNHSWN